jgi:3-aminobutyryl-CoA ammonia-lyase
MRPKFVSLRREGIMEQAFIRIRVGEEQVHYSGGLVDGAYCLKLFGDVATELAIRHDGDEGLFAGYESIEFLAPVFAGDFLEAEGEIIKVGNTSRKMKLEAKKVITTNGIGPFPSSADVLEEPIVVCRAIGTFVVKKEQQRKKESKG